MAVLKRNGFLFLLLLLPLCAGACTPTPVNDPPVANAGPDQTVDVGAEVLLNGIQSYDPEGKPLKYTWSFDFRPTGSTAQLQDAASVHCRFTPDVAGDYVIKLTVSDGAASDSDTATIRAGSGGGGTPDNDPPVADAGDDQSVMVGQLVTLDGSGSMDPDGDTLTYLWNITSLPAGSAAALTGAGTANPSFTPDVAGVYVVQLTVSDGQFTDEDSVTVNASLSGSFDIETFDFTLVDAAYSRELDRIIMVEYRPIRLPDAFFLHVYDPVTGIDETLRLNMRPNCLALSPDGLYAAVGHDARISYVSLAPEPSLVRELDCTMNIAELVLPGNGYVYTFPKLVNLPVSIVDINNNTETITSFKPGSVQVVMYPGASNTAFAVDGAQLYQYSFESGTINLVQTYGIDLLQYPPGDNLWFSDTGDRVITKTAKIYWWHPTLKYHGSLDTCLSVQSLDHYSLRDQYVVIPVSPDDKQLRIYSYPYHTADVVIELPEVTYSGAPEKWPGKFVFFNRAGDKIYVLAAPSESDACAVITLNTP